MGIDGLEEFLSETPRQGFAQLNGKNFTWAMEVSGLSLEELHKIYDQSQAQGWVASVPIKI